MTATDPQTNADWCLRTPSALSDAIVTPLVASDLPNVTQLHDEVFGPGRFARTAYRVREGAPELSPACCKLEVAGKLIGAVQMTWITVGASAKSNPRGMLLGPLAVDQDYANVGCGQTLIASAVEKADVHGAKFVILVGDLPYYEKSGFERVPLGSICLPGPVDRNRLLIRRLGGMTELPTGELRAVIEI